MSNPTPCAYNNKTESIVPDDDHRHKLALIFFRRLTADNSSGVAGNDNQYSSAAKLRLAQNSNLNIDRDDRSNFASIHQPVTPGIQY